MVKPLGLIPVALVALLCTEGCTSSQLVADLSAVVDAASVAVAFVPSLSPQAKAEIAKYLRAIAQASSESSVILASGQLNAVMVARIVELFARVALPVIPGVPLQVSAAIDAVAAAVTAFLGQLQPIQAHTSTSTTRVKLNRADSEALVHIKTKAAQVVMDLQKAGY